MSVDCIPSVACVVIFGPYAMLQRCLALHTATLAPFQIHRFHTFADSYVNRKCADGSACGTPRAVCRATSTCEARSKSKSKLRRRRAWCVPHLNTHNDCVLQGLCGPSPMSTACCSPSGECVMCHMSNQPRHSHNRQRRGTPPQPHAARSWCSHRLIAASFQVEHLVTVR